MARRHAGPQILLLDAVFTLAAPIFGTTTGFPASVWLR